MTIQSQGKYSTLEIPIRLASNNTALTSQSRPASHGERPTSQKHEIKQALSTDNLITNEAINNNNTSLICITIYIFRGEPDTYYNRHVLAYFTSPDNPGFHETVHTQRDSDDTPWIPIRESEPNDWLLIVNYHGHVNAGAVHVPRGQETALVDLVASANVQGRETDSGWNCQHYLLEGLQKLVDCRIQTQAWYDVVQEELMDRLLEGAVP